jgi:hypothetical protein
MSRYQHASGQATKALLLYGHTGAFLAFQTPALWDFWGQECWTWEKLATNVAIDLIEVNTYSWSYCSDTIVV